MRLHNELHWALEQKCDPVISFQTRCLQRNSKTMVRKNKNKSHNSSPWKWFMHTLQQRESERHVLSQHQLPQHYSNDWQGLKNWQQRAAWSNVIWLVAKCVIVASIRARRKRRLSVDVSLVGELMDLQYCLTDFRGLTSWFFFFFSNMYFSHLFWKWELGLSSQAWNESNLFDFGSLPVSLNGYNG